MRKSWTSLIFLLMIGMFFLPSRNDQVAAEPLTVRVGAYENPPKIFITPEGTVDGFFADIVNYIANEEGWTLQWVTGNWTDCLQRLESSDIDVMVDVAYSAERAQTYNFSNEAVFVNWGTVYTKTDSAIESIVDLQDKVVVVMADSIHTTGAGGILNLLDQFHVNCTIIEVEDYDGVFEYLDQGKADAGVVNRIFGMSNENKYKVRKTTIIFNPVDLKFAFTKNGPLTAQLIPIFDEHLKEIKADPNSVYYESLEKHLLGQSVREGFELPTWVLPVLVVSICFIGFLIVLSASLRLRKKELQQTNLVLNSLNTELETLVAMIPDGILVLDKNGIVRLVNDTFNAIYKHTVGQVLEPGKNLTEIKSNQPIHDAIIQLLASLESNPTTVEATTGTWVQLIATYPRIESESEPFGVIIEARDITYFVEYDNLRKQFVSMVSHELRTPITAIDLALRNLERFREKMTEEQKNLMIDSMARSAKVLKEMIEDLLVLSRVDAQRISLDKGEFNLRELVDSIEIQLSSKMKIHDISLVIDVPSELVLYADQTRIGQVVRILLDNATKFSPESATVTIKAFQSKGATKGGKLVEGTRIEVIDHGIGIREKDKARIFERFFRSEDVRDIQGTGLGLSIAREFVILHGGEITVESTFGEGATFSVFLPATSED